MFQFYLILQRVWRQAKKAKLLDEVYIATDDERIAKVVESFGGKYIMTSKECETGSDRICECLPKLDPKYQVIVNIQGDEPLVEPEHIDDLAALLHNDTGADMGYIIVIRTHYYLFSLHLSIYVSIYPIWNLHNIQMLGDTNQK